MQERRILTYIDKEDIPSSATELTSSNYSSIYGKVVYIPRNGYTGTVTNSQDQSISFKIQPAQIYSYTQYNSVIVSINNLTFTNNEFRPYVSYMSTSGTVYLNTKDSTYSYCNTMYVRISSGQGYLYFGMTLNGNASIPVFSEQDDIIYYDKVVFLLPVNITNVGSEVFTNYPPIYIDNE